MKTVITGNPDHAHISTSLVERSNLTVRMMMRRYIRQHPADERLLEATPEPHRSLRSFTFHHNFVRIHRSLRITPPAWPQE